MAGESYTDVFGQIIADIEADMRAARAAQSEVAPILWEIIDYQFGWDLAPDDVEAFQKISGKKIRPLLMALVARAISGGYQHVLPAGTALEFLHNFTLIHDDVMDKSLERRHRPAVWTRWGSAQAINAGDGLFALANQVMARLAEKGIAAKKIVQAMALLAESARLTAEGQILDMDFETREIVHTDEYITMIEHKSAVLIEFAARTGALLSTDDQSLIDTYGRFARSLGIAFQVRDDYLGIWGDETKTGKSATSDLREKKKSYPVLVAFEQASDTDRATLQAIYAQESLTEADIDTVLGILDRVDAAGQTDRIARTYYDRAMNELNATGIHNDTQNLIRMYAAFLVRRAY